MHRTTIYNVPEETDLNATNTISKWAIKCNKFERDSLKEKEKITQLKLIVNKKQRERLRSIA